MERQGDNLLATKLWSICSLILCVLNLVSGLYLGSSIYSIKKKMTEQDDAINVRIMTVHVASFSIYIVSTLLYSVTLLLFAEIDLDYKYFEMADTLSIVCSSIT